MKKALTLALTTVFLLFLVTECDRPEGPMPEPEEFGYLSLNVALQVEAQPVSGRVEAVSPDNFLVTIHDTSDGTEVIRWDTYLEVPSEVQLPTGSYFVRATNLEFPADAAFEQPWYFGESHVFTIDKEELKTVDVTCTLANCKISFSYSQNVDDNFTSWNATATIDDGNGTGAFLEWIQNDPAEGYFLTDLPIDIEVFLEYIKLTDPDQSITRTFSHTISDPQPATHYLVNVDALLEDGKIMINISVNEDFETIEIPLGDEVIPETVTDIDGNEYPVVQIGDQIWMAENLRTTTLNDGILIDEFQTNGAYDIPRYAWYNNDEENNKYLYGGMYNWYAVETGNLCPSGWHIPSRGDFTALREYLGGESIAGSELKYESIWFAPNPANNNSGFSALPGGFYDHFVDAEFYSLGQQGYLWTIDEDESTQYGYSFYMVNSSAALYEGLVVKSWGISVRCIQD